MPGGTSAQKLTADGGFDATVYIPTGQYEAGVTPISAKGFIDTATDTSWIAQSAGSRAIPGANGAGSSQVFSNSTTTVVTAWNQDLVTTQGITYSSGIWTIATAGVYEVYAKLGFLDGDASGSNTIGNPSSSSFIQTMTHILYSSDGTDPTASEILVRGPIYLQTNGTGISAKGSEAKTVRRFDVGDKIAIGCFVRLQSNQSSIEKYRLRSRLLQRVRYQEGWMMADCVSVLHARYPALLDCFDSPFFDDGDGVIYYLPSIGLSTLLRLRSSR